MDNDSPVICAMCEHTGRFVTLQDGKHLTCELKDNKPIYGSKPSWCPLKKKTSK